MNRREVYRRLVGGMGTRKSPNGSNGIVVPIKSAEAGSKIGSAAFRMRLKRLTETNVPFSVSLTWL